MSNETTTRPAPSLDDEQRALQQVVDLVTIALRGNARITEISVDVEPRTAGNPATQLGSLLITGYADGMPFSLAGNITP